MTDGRIIPWRRVAGITAALGVGAIAAIGSFAHLRDLAIEQGQTRLIGTLIPFSVDGLIVCATFFMDGHNRIWPRIGFWLGVTATICGNVLAAKLNPASIAVSVWPPVALLAVIEILVPRKTDAVVSPSELSEPAELESVPAVEVPEPASKPRTTNRRGDTTRQKVAKVAAKMPDAKPVEIAVKAGVSESTARRLLTPKTDDPDAELAELTKEEVTA